jgi:DNA/RNA endonuclease G (NUC1)
MSPQIPAFNRIHWRNLETTVRSKACREEKLIIITGPIFDKDRRKHKKIGVNQFTIPVAFFKVLYSPKNESMVCYIMDHTKEGSMLTTNVDHIESITGFDFFKALPDDIEVKLERKKQW